MSDTGVDDARARLIRILDTFTCGVLAETEGRLVFVNQKLAHMLGVDRHQLWGRPIEQLVPGELRETLLEDAQRAADGDLRARLTALLCSDGTTHPVLVLPMTVFETLDGEARLVRFAVVIDLGAVMTAKHSLYYGEDELRGSLTRIAIDLQTASLLAGGSPAAHPELHHPELDALSKREREVLSHLVVGERVPTIAEKLFISQHTVRNHLKSMFRKLDVGSQGELIERIREIH